MEDVQGCHGTKKQGIYLQLLNIARANPGFVVGKLRQPFTEYTLFKISENPQEVKESFVYSDLRSATVLGQF